MQKMQIKDHKNGCFVLFFVSFFFPFLFFRYTVQDAMQPLIVC